MNNIYKIDLIKNLQKQIKDQKHELKIVRQLYEKYKSETNDELQARLEKARYALEDIAFASSDKDYSRISNTLKEYYDYEIKKIKEIEKSASYPLKTI